MCYENYDRHLFSMHEETKKFTNTFVVKLKHIVLDTREQVEVRIYVKSIYSRFGLD
jgi:hypothetical protein